MSSDQNPVSSDQNPSKAELESEIAELRQSVGDTVDALNRKLDVKARATERVRSVPPSVPVGAAALMALGLILWFWRRRG